MELVDNLALFFQNKQNLINILVLAILILGLPVGVNLIKQQQVIRSMAVTQPIQVVEGRCVTERGGKRVLICEDVPLKLISPLGGSDMTPTPPGGGTTVPTPTPGQPGPVVNIRNFNNNIQAAMDSIKATGGAVYVPSGTYTITEKIRLFSNTILFGDGIDKTILQLDSALLTDPDGILANDTNYGHQNIVIRDITFRGLFKESGILNCCAGIKLRQLDGGFLDNIKVEGFSWHGIWLAYKKQTTGNLDAVEHVRISNCQILNNKGSGIAIDSPQSNNIVDHCVFSGNNLGTGGDKNGGAAVNLFMDEDGLVTKNKILNNTITSNFSKGISVVARNNITAIQTTKILNNAICNNTVENNGKEGIADGNSEENKYIANKINNNNDKRDGKVQTGNIQFWDFSILDWFTTTPGSSLNMTEDERPEATNPDCNIPPALQNIPSAPPKPAVSFEKKNNDFNLIKEVFAKDQKTPKPTQTPKPTKTPKGSATSVPTTTPTPSQTSSPTPVVSPTPTPQPLLKTVSFKVAESVSGLATAQSIPYEVEPMIFNYILKDKNPGFKQFWVEFTGSNGQKVKSSINIELVEKDPEITNVSCRLDISQEKVVFDIGGKRFGLGNKTRQALANGLDLRVLSWSQEKITAIHQSSSRAGQNQLYFIELIRDDGQVSEPLPCEINTVKISLGAKTFCRESGKFDVTGVEVIFIDADGKKTQETATITKDGLIQNLKTILEAGKQYTVYIKAPAGLRRSGSFIASEGTTVLMSDMESSFILPVGDIFPVDGGDGVINSADKAELNREWGQSKSSSALRIGDFNRDKRVNSFDWACMRYDFGSRDEQAP
ncbi:right-handed parallel beta-helix repeat-containing protein [Candidatus Daviesbacteria bacterium]|nr:right-handed parallel beta-helix repeat-containing protein [Candidatus Daviesbacteria bacterium]